MSSTPEYVNYDLKIENQVARIGISSDWWSGGEGPPPPDIHYELFEIMNYIRTDSRVRVVVIQGATDGVFHSIDAPPNFKQDEDPAAVLKAVTARSDMVFKAGAGVVQLFETMAALDRPIIAKVNGDAIAFGSSIVFGCDLIVAREDARIADNHLGMGEVEPAWIPNGVVPGDGGAALVPLHMSPARAKEYLMLARVYTGAELARAGIINYAVPAQELDALTESLVERLLRRNAHALAWTKRVANKHVARQLQVTLDAGFAYQALSAQQLGVDGGDRFTLEGPASEPA